MQALIDIRNPSFLSSERSPTNSHVATITATPSGIPDEDQICLFDQTTSCSFTKTGDGISLSGLDDQCVLWDSSCSGNMTAAADEFFEDTLWRLEEKPCWRHYTLPACTSYEPAETMSEMARIKDRMRTPQCTSIAMGLGLGGFDPGPALDIAAAMVPATITSHQEATPMVARPGPSYSFDIAKLSSSKYTTALRGEEIQTILSNEAADSSILTSWLKSQSLISQGGLSHGNLPKIIKDISEQDHRSSSNYKGKTQQTQMSRTSDEQATKHVLLVASSDEEILQTTNALKVDMKSRTILIHGSDTVPRQISGENLSSQSTSQQANEYAEAMSTARRSNSDSSQHAESLISAFASDESLLRHQIYTTPNNIHASERPAVLYATSAHYPFEGVGKRKQTLGPGSKAPIFVTTITREAAVSYTDTILESAEKTSNLRHQMSPTLREVATGDTSADSGGSALISIVNQASSTYINQNVTWSALPMGSKAAASSNGQTVMRRGKDEACSSQWKTMIAFVAGTSVLIY